MSDAHYQCNAAFNFIDNCLLKITYLSAYLFSQLYLALSNVHFLGRVDPKYATHHFRLEARENYQSDLDSRLDQNIKNKMSSQYS